MYIFFVNPWLMGDTGGRHNRSKMFLLSPQSNLRTEINKACQVVEVAKKSLQEIIRCSWTLVPSLVSWRRVELGTVVTKNNVRANLTKNIM